LSDPAYYSTSDYYQPGIMTEVGWVVFGIGLILVLFIASVLGARYLLASSRHLRPGTRRILELLSGLARPSEAVSAKRRRRHERELSSREAGPRYKLQIAAAGPELVAAPGAIDRPAAAEQPFGRRRIAQDLSLAPEEAWPFYAEDEIEAVVALLRSGKVNQWTGSKVFEFERAYTRHLGNSRAIALANGSVALELALRALGVGAGDDVIVTPRTFVASAFCAQLVGANPVFADVDRDSGNMTADSVAAVLTTRTRAIIPVHIGGWPADMPAIMALARDKGIHVIEDCAQAQGAEIDSRSVGSFGDAASFSFCQDKIISTGGEGGLVALRDDDAYEYAWSFKDHGKDRKRALERPAEPGFRWLHDRVGTNWRMTEISAAIGLLQLEKLSQWRAQRAANAAIWADALRKIPALRVPQPAQNLVGAYYKFYAYVDADPADNRALRDQILARAAAAGLRVFSGSCSEVYREAAFADLAVAPLPVAHALGESSLMLEVHPTLDRRRLRDRADALASIIAEVLR